MTEIYNKAILEIALDGVHGSSVTQLWNNLERKVGSLSRFRKSLIIDDLIHESGFTFFMLPEPRPLLELPNTSTALCLYGDAVKYMTPMNTSFTFKQQLVNPVHSRSIGHQFGFCPDRLKRRELKLSESESMLSDGFDESQLIIVAPFSLRLKALLPDDSDVSELENETFAVFAYLEYLAKCRSRGAFLTEVRQDAKFDLDLYPVIQNLSKKGFIKKLNLPGGVMTVLSHMCVHREDYMTVTEKYIALFDEVSAKYYLEHPLAECIPRSEFCKHFPTKGQLVRFIDHLKKAGAVKTVWKKVGRITRIDFMKILPDDTYKSFLMRCDQQPSDISESATESTSAADGSKLEPKESLSAVYRNLMHAGDADINSLQASLGMSYNTARGVDKCFMERCSSSVKSNQIEFAKTVKRVRSSIATVDSPLESPKKSFTNYEFADAGIKVNPEDLAYKHKFFRTEQQKFRRSVIYQLLNKLVYMEIPSGVQATVHETETSLGMTNPKMDRKSVVRFANEMVSEGDASFLDVEFTKQNKVTMCRLLVKLGTQLDNPVIKKLVAERSEAVESAKEEPSDDSTSESAVTIRGAPAALVADNGNLTAVTASDYDFNQVFSQLNCSTMDKIIFLHRILLYKVHSIETSLPDHFKQKLDQITLTPCIHGAGWLVYRDILNLVPMRLVMTLMGRKIVNFNLFKYTRYSETSFTPIGLMPKDLQDTLRKNFHTSQHLNYLVCMLSSLGLLTILMRPKRFPTERNLMRLVFLNPVVHFYDTSQSALSLESSGTAGVGNNHRLMHQSQPYPLESYTLTSPGQINAYWLRLQFVCRNSPDFQFSGQAINVKRRAFTYTRSTALIREISKVSDMTSVPCEPFHIQFGVAGTELRLCLQDPVHWESESKMRTSGVAGKGNTFKAMAAKVYGPKSTKQARTKSGSNDMEVAGRIIKKHLRHALKSSISQCAYVAKTNLFTDLRKQKSINEGIRERKMKFRVSWMETEDSVLTLAWLAYKLLRSRHPSFYSNNTYFIRDILHKELDTASDKDSLSVSKRFYYIFNHDAATVKKYYLLAFFSLRDPAICSFIRDKPDSPTDAYQRFSNLYSIISNHPFSEGGSMIRELSSTAGSEFEEVLPSQKVGDIWVFDDAEMKVRRHNETFMLLILSYYFDKYYNLVTLSALLASHLMRNSPGLIDLFQTCTLRFINTALTKWARNIYGKRPFHQNMADIAARKSADGTADADDTWLMKKGRNADYRISKNALARYLFTRYQDSLEMKPLLDDFDSGKIVGNDGFDCNSGHLFMLSSLLDIVPSLHLSMYMERPLAEFPMLRDVDDRDVAPPVDGESSFNCLSADDTFSVDEIGPINPDYLDDAEQLSAILADPLASEHMALNFDQSSLSEAENTGFTYSFIYHKVKLNAPQERSSQIVLHMPVFTFENLNSSCLLTYPDLKFEQRVIEDVLDLFLLRTPTDVELMQGIPLYITLNEPNNFADSLDSSSLSPHEKLVYEAIVTTEYSGVEFLELERRFVGHPLVSVLAELILKGFILINGISSVRFVSRKFAVFIESLSYSDTADVAQLERSGGLTKFQMIPNAFTTLDGRLSKTFFATIFCWAADYSTVSPGKSFMDLAERVQSFVCPVQLFRLLKVMERLNILKLESVPGYFLTDNFFGDGSEHTVNPLEQIYVKPAADCVLRVRDICRQYSLKPELPLMSGTVGPSMISDNDAFRLRRSFDPDSCLF